MVIGVVLGIVLTAVALLGLLGNSTPKSAKASQLFVYALPIGIVAAGYATSIGISIGWALVVVASAFLAILLGGLLGRQPVASDEQDRGGSAGLNLVCSGGISIGLGVVVIIWASHLISAFSYLDGAVVSIALVLAAVAYAVGGRAEVGLARTVLTLAIIGAVVMLAVGVLGGDISGLSAPQVPVPALNPVEAILYAIGVVIIGAGYPVMRAAGVGNRGKVVVAAVLVALVTLVTLVGIMSLYGGAFQLPSLVINVLPVYSPPVVSAVVCGFLAIVSSVVAGGAIRTASHYVGLAHPGALEPSDRVLTSPRLWINVVLGAVIVVIVVLAPQPTWIVLFLAVLGIANLLVEWSIARSRKKAAGGGDDAAVNEKEPATT